MLEAKMCAAKKQKTTTLPSDPMLAARATSYGEAEHLHIKSMMLALVKLKSVQQPCPKVVCLCVCVCVSACVMCVWMETSLAL